MEAMLGLATGLHDDTGSFNFHWTDNVSRYNVTVDTIVRTRGCQVTIL